MSVHFVRDITYFARHQPALLLSNLALFLMPAMATTVKSGFTYPSALLTIVGTIIFVRAENKGGLPADARWLFLSFFPLALCWLLDDLISGLGGRGVEKPLRILLTLPALWYLARTPPNHIWLWLGVSLGAIAGCIQAVHQFFFMGMERAQGAMFSIHFGDLVLMLGLMGLCAWNLPFSKYRWIFRVWLLLGCFSGLLASILSGTRGAWLGLCVIALVYMTYLLLSGRYRLLTSLVTISLIITVVIFNIPTLRVETRIKEATTQFELFNANNTAYNSVGARLQMWQQSWKLYRERPLLGWQRQGYLEQQQLGIERKQLDPRLAQYDHPHNEIFNAAAKQGTIGLTALFIAYCGPFWLFMRIFRTAYNPALRAVSAAGMLVPIAYFGFGLTEAFLPHVSVITVYVYFLSLLLGTTWGLQWARNSSDEISIDHSP
ncbi:MAG: O-antigen ligase family protein [Brachymonas sp.]